MKFSGDYEKTHLNTGSQLGIRYLGDVETASLVLDLKEPSHEPGPSYSPKPCFPFPGYHQNHLNPSK